MNTALPEQTVSPDFSAAAAAKKPLIQGRLRPASDETVAAMKRRFMDRINAAVEEALPPEASHELRTACWAFFYTLSKVRKPLKAATFKALLQGGDDALKAAEQAVGLSAERAEKEKIYGYQLDKIKKRLSELPANHAAAAESYCVTCAKAQQRIPAEEILSALISGGQDAINAFRKHIGGTITTSLAKKAILKKREKDAEKKLPADHKNALDRLFGGKERLYFHLDDESKSPVQPVIEAFLKEKGYSDVDYAGGYASDSRKNRCKIGKILKDEPGMLQAFTSDPLRYGKNLMVVMSRSPYDIGRGSYGRGWQSCRANENSVICNGSSEGAAGVIALYLVREDDPNIHDPLTRLFIKPYNGNAVSVDEEGQLITAQDKTFIYQAFNPIGLHYPALLDAANRFADETFNEGKYGKFHLDDDCESYREFSTRHRLPRNAFEALRIEGIPLSRKDGKITVQDLHLSDLGLTALPDLSDVTVKGIFNCAGNRLLSLQGAPQNPVETFNCERNLLVGFADCPPVHVNKLLAYDDNPFLASIHGIPKAGKYSFGNGSHSDTMDANPVCPTQKPSIFPGFKRK